MPLISVIVPVYNAEKHLHKCIDSILAQTFTDFELLLINDGSTDGSGVICNEYAQRDSRIRVYHKPNGGVSSARNVGLNHAIGYWIAFVDSDDWAAPLYLEHLINHTSEDIDLVISYATIISANISYINGPFTERLLLSDEIEVAFEENYLHGNTSPWSKLYRKSIIDTLHLQFCEKIHIGEDALFLFTYLLHCRYLYISNDTDYHYNFDGNDTLTKRVNDFESEVTGYHKITRIITELCKCKNIKSSTAMQYLDWMCGYYARRVLNAVYHNKVDRRTRLKTIMSLDLRPYIYGMYIPATKEKILAFLLKHRMLRTYDFLRVISHRFLTVITT